MFGLPSLDTDHRFAEVGADAHHDLIWLETHQYL